MHSRRTVLTAALAAGALGACTAEGGPPTRPPDPDTTLAAEALAAQTAIVALLDSLTRRRPRRVLLMAATRTVHEEHVRLLIDAVPDAEAPAASPGPSFSGNDRAALIALAKAEDELVRTLRGAALRAESGPFARVLACMAAASAQQAVTVRSRA